MPDMIARILAAQQQSQPAAKLQGLLNNPSAGDLLSKSDPVTPTDPAQQIRNYLTSQRLLDALRRPPRLSPYSRDTEEFQATPTSPSQIDRMPLDIISKLFMKT
jgi:hypothetical protein